MLARTSKSICAEIPLSLAINKKSPLGSSFLSLSAEPANLEARRHQKGQAVASMSSRSEPQTKQATARKNDNSLRLCALARKRFVLFFFKNKLFLAVACSFLYSRYYGYGDRKKEIPFFSFRSIQLHIQQGILKGLCLKARGFHSINKEGD